MLNLVSSGFLFNGSLSYLRNPWNLIDFFIVIISVVSMVTVSDLSFFKAVRILRLLRPLRVIQRNEGLKIAVHALFMAIPNIMYVSIVAGLFFAIFGMTGVNIFKGQFYSCKGIEDANLLSTVSTKHDCIDKGGVWMNFDSNFDNIFIASTTLFEMSTTEGWVDVMFLGVDSRGVDLEPKKNTNRAYTIYFVMFIIIGSFFMLNLFVGVVISTFNLEKENLGKNYLLTATQKEWIDTRMNIVKMKPLKTSDYKDRLCFKIIDNKYFEFFILGCIILNTIALGLNWYQRPDIIDYALEVINYVFTGIFTMEALMRILGLGFKRYFKDGWNIFDIIIILGSYIGILIEAFTTLSVGVQTTILRAFRISRILRLVRRAKSLNIIFETFLITIPALANIGGLLILFLYLYAIIGVSLFAEVKLQNDLNSHSNFQSFTSSFITLFRSSTGENWNSIMHDITRDKSPLFDCIENPSYEDYVKHGETVGCGNYFGQAFFMSFILIVQLIFLNLFIAIILQGFDFMNKKANMILKDEVLLDYKVQWAKFDPKGTGFMECRNLNTFLTKIGGPLGFDSVTIAHQERQKDFITSLDLCTYSRCKYYNFYDILRKLAKNLILKIKLENEKNIDLKTGQKFFIKLRSELDFENTQRAEEIEAIKGLTKIEVKVDRIL